MSLRPFELIAAGVLSTSLICAPFAGAFAGGGYGGGTPGHGPHCNDSKSINIFKPVVINKNINVFKPVIINKNIDINKNVNINKNINVIKNIVIDKSSAVASAEASAFAAASANAGAGASTVVYGGGSYENVTINNHSSEVGGVHAENRCEVQEATVVKAIHAVCVAEGHEFFASHMLSGTFIDSAYEGEVARCIAGAHLKVVIGDVLQSDQGMAGTYEQGTVIECAEHEALRHFKDGMLKCAPQVAVPDCTERTNLRRYGTGDMFFSYRSKVCVSGARTAERDTDLSGMSLEGGVGTQGY